MRHDLEPTRRPSVLIVSNGRGEDAVGMALAVQLTPHADVVAYPLVGRGDVYRDVRLLDPRMDLPSGGFALRAGWRRLVADLRQGALRHWRDQRQTLVRQARQHEVTIAVGDVYCLWMTAQARAPAIFVATAKSEYNEPHRALERVLIRRQARAVFVRDPLTAKVLAAQGIPARYVGNPLMDTIHYSGDTLPVVGGSATVTLLPGSRADASINMALLLKLALSVGRQADVRWLCVLAPTLEADQVHAAARAEGWVVDRQILRAGSTEVFLTGAFGEALREADVVVGLAGTANEQAAGLGKPVVAFPGSGVQFTKQFLALQGRLLGDAVVTMSGWEDASRAVVRLLRDPQERQRRGQIGRARMGSPGAIRTIAGEVRTLLEALCSQGQAPPC